MQSICLLFAGRRGLNDEISRQSILRIPEVSRKLKEAQRIIDQTLDSNIHVDLFSFLNTPDYEFNANTSLKSLVAATVQIGLFERYVKYRNRPQFLIGRVNGCSAMKVCADMQSFEEFVVTSRFCRENTLMLRFTQQGLKLSGMELEECGVLTWNEEGFYEKKEVENKEASGILEEISASHLINQCIHIGPTSDFHEKEMAERGLFTISSMSSIDLDPILSSFWKTA